MCFCKNAYESANSGECELLEFGLELDGPHEIALETSDLEHQYQAEMVVRLVSIKNT
jgi:hypothetical protein